MRLKLQLAASVALMCSGCTHQVVTAPQAPPRTAVATAMGRHISNAADAGEGDLEARSLRQRLARDARDLNARILLARMYNRGGLPDLALEHYRMAVSQFPDSPVAALELAKTLRQMGEVTEALTVLEQGAARLPRSWEFPSLTGILQDERGFLPTAEGFHRAALAIDGSRAGLHNNLGYNLLLQGKVEEAAAELKRAVELDPRSQLARNNLGAALAAGSQTKEALEEWRRSADAAVAHNNLAAVLMEHGRDAEAREQIQTALGFRPGFAPALANLRLLAARTGDNVEVPVTGHANSWWGRITSWGRPHKTATKTP